MININRRVLDNVAITALNKHGDPELTKSISDMFGVGTLVEDAKIEQVVFNKSMLGLSVTSMTGIIRKLSKELKPNVDIGNVVDSDGHNHAVSVEVVSLLKAVTFYSITCPTIVVPCIRSLLIEIDNWFKHKTTKSLITISLDDSGDVDEANNKLMEYCRKEIFGLLREAGVEID